MVNVVVIGGGCAGLAAAWQLSKQKRFKIHVYEQSARLGGKGASERDGNGRILDHGLHVWLGFYENAFRMMRECYGAVGENGWSPLCEPPDRLVHGRFEDAFFPEPNIGVIEPSETGFAAWTALFPPEPGLPGEPLDEESNPFTVANYLLRCITLLRTLMVSVIGPVQDVPGPPRPDERSRTDEVLNHNLPDATSVAALIERMSGAFRAGLYAGAAALAQALWILETWLQKVQFTQQVADAAPSLALAVATQARKLFSDLSGVDPAIRTKAEIIDIVLTIMVGLFQDRVMFSPQGLDSLNSSDYRDWLRKHGASQEALGSRFLTGIYDLLFAYQDGDKAKPRLAAGVALRGAFRMFFTYRGSMFWRMRSGMGEAVFAPLWKVLSTGRPITAADGTNTRAEPVSFHFLHRLEQITSDNESRPHRITSLSFQLLGDDEKIEALRLNPLDAFGSWPRDPAEKAAAGPRSIEVDDFDAVILATGIDDVRVLRLDKFKDGPPAGWLTMLDQVRTVGTQSAQVWMSKSIEELGWHRGSALITALGLQFDTWADMTHTLPTERAWRETLLQKAADGGVEPRSVAYFCAPLPDAATTGRDPTAPAVEAGIGQALDIFMHRSAGAIWPATMVHDGTTAYQSVISRHLQANFSGSARYTLSSPGSLSYRISPLARTFENATIAGDWTACGLDAGCIEAAVMSGMLAAFAISGEEPKPEQIVGFDHP